MWRVGESNPRRYTPVVCKDCGHETRRAPRGEDAPEAPFGKCGKCGKGLMVRRPVGLRYTHLISR